MFPRSPEHAVVFPIIPEAVSVVMLAGTVAFWCHFALKSDLLTGLFRCCQVSAICLCAHYINPTFTTSLQKTFFKKQTFRMDKKGWMYIRMDRTEEAFNAVIKNKYDMR